MTTSPITGSHATTGLLSDADRDTRHYARPAHGDETKPSWKTTELFVYLAAVAGVLLASQLVGDRGVNDGSDYFAADKAWWYVTLLTIGYLISRGLAKSGTRSRDADPRTR
ncbi:hypothetical protein AB0C12_00315 [Actinoplanes sp. NPDC048967]|uniref:hypothetical protein n=1 Tax=Actinoplanes sp. NPDC048967 TaxID=3155269 RepID=UPI00340569C6